MQRKSMLVGLCVVNMSAFGCALSSSSNTDNEVLELNHQGSAVAPDREVITVSVQEIHASFPISNVSKTSISKDEMPTGVLIATCESDPDEVAVPLNVSMDRYCSTLQAFAYRDDDGDVYDVSADYTWSVADTAIALIRPLPGKEHASVQEPQVMYDIFSSEDQSFEPSTMATVCAIPKGGGNWPYHQQFCESVPINAVVNLESAWCFSGATFVGDCDALKVVQDGRLLIIDQVGKGYVNTKFVSFRMSGKLYLADLVTRDSMSGFVVDSVTQDYIGTWQAWRLPLY